MLFLPISFFITAFLYACIGFGGGSTYNALLVLNNTDYLIIPLISLICNILVVCGGFWHFNREGHINLKCIFPWILFSVPASFIGGLIIVPEIAFIGILGFALFISGIKLLWPEMKTSCEINIELSKRKYIPPIISFALGILAGITGIGGGIFLAPILHFLRWGNAKQIAGACSLFILANSLAGVAGQIIKITTSDLTITITPYWLLLPTVIFGGQIGSWLGAAKINTIIVKKMTAILILYVSAKLIVKFLGLLQL